MSAIERRLSEALTGGAMQVEPAPDLFARVRSSIDDDRRRRRRLLRRGPVGVIVLVAVVSLVIPGLGSRGGLGMDWWVLELLTTLLLIGLALWLGPFIKRFGRAYAADVFHDNPLTGKSYIILTDIVYYLIFTARILFTVHFERTSGWPIEAGAAQLQYEAARVGGILLIIGVLHGFNILIMPVLGRLFSLNRRLQPPTAKPHLRSAPDVDS
jgi:hypothetical protein